jgi:hypothetical protein
VACNIAKQNKQLWTVYGGHSWSSLLRQ